MMWALMIITATGLQTAGNYTNKDLCDQAAKEWQRQEIKAACSQSESPEAAMQKMTSMMKSMMKSMDERTK
jgi:hypothetical protein